MQDYLGELILQVLGLFLLQSSLQGKVKFKNKNLKGNYGTGDLFIYYYISTRFLSCSNIFYIY